MLRTLLGSAIGLLVGLGLGFVLFSSTGPRTAPPPIAQPAHGEVLAKESMDQAKLQAPQSWTESGMMAAEPGKPKASPISESRVQDTLARVALQPSERRRGELEFWGHVSDANGAGLPGVLVRATANDAMARLQKPGDFQRDSQPATLDETVRRAAQEFQDKSARRFHGTTNSEGEYRLTDIPVGSFYLQAFKDSYTLNTQGQTFRNIPAGSEVNFAATALVELDVSITMPDGSVPEQALIKYDSKQDDRSRHQSWAWSPDDRVLHLPAKEVKLTAYGGMPNYLSQIGNSADFVSESVTLDLATDAPTHIEFILAGRRGIRGRISFAEDLISTTNAQVHLLPLGEASDVDMELLATTESFNSVQNGSDFAFLDLEPGRYVVGLSRSWNAPIEDHEVLTVERGITHSELMLPQIDSTKFIHLQVLDPEGKTLPSVRFGMRQTEDGRARTSSSGMQGLRAKDGSYFITVPENMRSAFYGKPNEAMGFSVSARHLDYGSRSTDIVAGQGEAQIQFNEGADLEITITGLINGPYAGRVSALLHAVGDNHYYSGSNNRIGPSSVFSYGKQEPGEYDLDLNLSQTAARHSQSHLIASVRVRLTAGFNSVEVAMPALYALNVLVPDATAGTRLYLQTISTEQGQRVSGWNATCEDGGEAQFLGLPGGEYNLRLSSGISRGSMKISVPTGRIVFEPDKR